MDGQLSRQLCMQEHLSSHAGQSSPLLQLFSSRQLLQSLKLQSAVFSTQSSIQLVGWVLNNSG